MASGSKKSPKRAQSPVRQRRRTASPDRLETNMDDEMSLVSDHILHENDDLNSNKELESPSHSIANGALRLRRTSVSSIELNSKGSTDPSSHSVHSSLEFRDYPIGKPTFQSSIFFRRLLPMYDPFGLPPRCNHVP
jgi:hypothetical protein